MITRTGISITRQESFKSSLVKSDKVEDARGKHLYDSSREKCG